MYTCVHIVKYTHRHKPRCLCTGFVPLHRALYAELLQGAGMQLHSTFFQDTFTRRRPPGALKQFCFIAPEEAVKCRIKSASTTCVRGRDWVEVPTFGGSNAACRYLSLSHSP